MDQLEFFTVTSPCVGVISGDDKGYRKGCMRKRKESVNGLNMQPMEHHPDLLLSNEN